MGKIFSALIVTLLLTNAAQAQEQVKIALLVAIRSNPVEQAIINEFDRVAKVDGHAEFVVFDSDNSVPKELANCDDIIASQAYDALALKAVAGAALVSCAEKALASGLRVVVFGNAIGPDPSTAVRQVAGVSASVVHLAKTNGATMADLVAQACAAKAADPCPIIYTYGPLAFDWAALTRQSFEENLAAKYPNILIVASEPSNFDANLARSVVTTMLQVHPEAQVVVSDVDITSLGAIDAVKDLGLVPGKDILVTGAALNAQGKAAIESGAMFGSTCLLPRTEAQAAAEYAILAARNLPIERPDFEVCPDASPLGLVPLTAENIAGFTPEW